ncbi:hypothetical protein [Leptospira borgpetersenii]|uniref:hypothetical protein n=1 Tax=Leptospira borgpetersenii TaxID=174 RepID=UPI00138AC493|nr:hypothetical protein [Leptospira borgpetersenii]MBF3351159.1 hypothetical protein [Leptospira borgpetersenii serovar Balcanica]MBF3377706.1 hypothetical protein [Leptospira borgpetersenii serovar Balcanica]
MSEFVFSALNRMNDWDSSDIMDLKYGFPFLCRTFYRAKVLKEFDIENRKSKNSNGGKSNVETRGIEPPTF